MCYYLCSYGQQKACYFGLYPRALCDQVSVFIFLHTRRDSSWKTADCWLYDFPLTLQKSCGYVHTLVGWKEELFCQCVSSTVSGTNAAVNTRDLIFCTRIKVKFLGWCVAWGPAAGCLTVKKGKAKSQLTQCVRAWLFILPFPQLRVTLLTVARSCS